VAGTYNEKVAEGGNEQRHSGEDQLPGVMLGLQTRAHPFQHDQHQRKRKS